MSSSSIGRLSIAALIFRGPRSPHFVNIGGYTVAMPDFEDVMRMAGCDPKKPLPIVQLRSWAQRDGGFYFMSMLGNATVALRRKPEQAGSGWEDSDRFDLFLPRVKIVWQANEAGLAKAPVYIGVCLPDKNKRTGYLTVPNVTNLATIPGRDSGYHYSGGSGSSKDYRFRVSLYGAPPTYEQLDALGEPGIGLRLVPRRGPENRGNLRKLVRAATLPRVAVREITPCGFEGTCYPP